MHDARQCKARKWRQSEPRLSPEALSIMWSKWNHKGHSLSKHWVTPPTCWRNHRALTSPQEVSHLAFKSYNLAMLVQGRARVIEVTKGGPNTARTAIFRIQLSNSPHSEWASHSEKALGEHSSFTVRTTRTHHYQRSLGNTVSTLLIYFTLVETNQCLAVSTLDLSDLVSSRREASNHRGFSQKLLVLLNASSFFILF